MLGFQSDDMFYLILSNVDFQLPWELHHCTYNTNKKHSHKSFITTHPHSHTSHTHKSFITTHTPSTHLHTLTKHVRQLVEEEGKGRGKSQRQAVGHGGTQGHTIGQDVQGVRYQEEQVRGTPPRAMTMAMTVGVGMTWAWS